jgi:hypothetical protein
MAMDYSHLQIAAFAAKFGPIARNCYEWAAEQQVYYDTHISTVLDSPVPMKALTGAVLPTEILLQSEEGVLKGPHNILLVGPAPLIRTNCTSIGLAVI